jgi:hypothetical protein
MNQDRKIATLVAFVALSLLMPPTGMERAMANPIVRKVTRLLTARPLGAIIAAKKLMRDTQRIPNRMDEEDSVFAQRLKTAEIAAFAERRPPNFRGLAS